MPALIPQTPEVENLVARQARERREQMVATARRMVLESGPDGVSVRALAAECGVSVPTLYRTFGSKEALLAEALQPFMDTDALRADLDAARVRGHKRLVRMLELWLDAAPSLTADGAGSGRALLEVFLATATGRASLERAADTLEELTREILDEMAERAELQSWVDVATLAGRITAQASLVPIEAARRRPSERSPDPPSADDAWRDDFFVGVGLLLAGATVGAANASFVRLVRRHQPGRA